MFIFTYYVILCALRISDVPLRALSFARPRRWELNDMAGRLGSQPAAVELCEGLVPAPASSVSGLSPDGYRMLPAIGELPEDSGRSSTWCGSTG
jgi:hypothetical protein